MGSEQKQKNYGKLVVTRCSICLGITGVIMGWSGYIAEFSIRRGLIFPPDTETIIFLLVIFSIPIFMVGFIMGTIGLWKSVRHHSRKQLVMAIIGILLNFSLIIYGFSEAILVPENYQEIRAIVEKAKTGEKKELVRLKQIARLGMRYAPLARESLGYMYETGQGVKQDYLRAAQWYRKSGTRDGAFRAGIMYEEGIGVPRDYAKAARLYRLAVFAAEGSHPEAAYHLGEMYEKGEGVGRYNVKAEQWYAYALRYLSIAISVNKNSRSKYLAPTYQLRAELSSKKHDTANALSDANRAISIDPAFYPAYATKARICDGAGLASEAVKSYRQFLAYAPDDIFHRAEREYAVSRINELRHR
jgi:tetratricopeptide (TPR) repeat protein